MRFVVDASGDMYTTVEGEKMVMEPGDLLLTPNWAWHDHTNGSELPAIWVDILDANLTRHLSAHFKELWPDGPVQPLARPEGYSLTRFGGLRPRETSDARKAVPYAYKWADALAAVRQLAVETEADPHEAYCLDYVNPINGGPTFPTMNCRLQMIPPHTTTKAIRRTGVTIYQVVSGRGSTYAAPGVGGVGHTHRTPGESKEDKTLAWGLNDFIMIPSWRWEQHTNPTDEPVYLFSVSDRPALEAFGWYREERA
jgi:gentisate 1,2-dioxygenase